MNITKSARLFRERAGLRRTDRSPAPTFGPNFNEVMHTPLYHPFPVAEAVSNGDPPPDRGLTEEPWHLGTDCEEDV